MADRMLSVLGRTGMRPWKLCSILTLAMGLGALGCGGGSSPTTDTVTISPTIASVITNTTQTFTPFVNGTTDAVVTWAVTCPTGVAATACGSIDTNGVYTAPKTVPTVTTNGTTVITPTATIKATAHADSTKTATATVTIVSGISISILPSSVTVGTGEFFNNFVATVNNPGCDNSVTINQCQVVTWSLSTTLTGVGTIDATTGNYKAPPTVPSPSSVTITATSVKDTTVTATATVLIVTASAPTLTSVSPNSAAVGSLFQDVYITGTNFISTNNVSVNGNVISGFGIDSLPNVSVVSSSVIRARIPDSLLASPGTLAVTVSQQSATQQQSCTVPAQCQVVVSAVRPVISGPSPDTIPQGTSGATSFNINGGFFGTNGTSAVHATYDGQRASATVTNARQMVVTIGSNATDFAIPGLHPVAVISDADATQFAVTNLAVQPNYASGGSTISNVSTMQLPAGSSPGDVAINPTTGLAIVANTGSDSVSFIDLAAPSLTLFNIPIPGGRTTTRLCTAIVTVNPGSACTASGPNSVAVDYVRNIALVVNATSQTIAVVDLNAKTVTSVTPLVPNPPSDAAQHPPVAVGINPLSGRALVTFKNRAYGLILDLTQTPPAIVGPVSISTGANSRIAVDPPLNWAIATPGGLGSIGIVDLNRQTLNNITSLSRTSNVVTVTLQPSTTAQSQTPLAVQLNDTVYIQRVADGSGKSTDTNSFEGFYSVTGLGPASGQFSYTQTAATLPDETITSATGTVNYSAPVARLALSNTVQGIGINTETQQAVLVDPSLNGGVVSFFSLRDQTVSSVILRTNNNEVLGPVETGSVAGAFNLLTNVAVTVNPKTNTLSVIDPSTLKRLNNTSPFPTRPDPVAVAVDPGSNLAVVSNQSDDSVSVFSLGAALQPVSIIETYPKEFTVSSTLQGVAPPSALTLTVIGKGLAGNPLNCTNGSTTAKVRLDGVPLTTTCIGTGDRELTAIVPPSLLTSARRYALDVLSPDGTTRSNATDFTVNQSVDVTTVCSTPPMPAGVTIDPVLNYALVSLSGCNRVAVIDLSTGVGTTFLVGTNPLGVAILPRLSTAVVANNQSGNATVLDYVHSKLTTITTGASPIGVAANQDMGTAAVANSVANTVSVLTVANSGAVSIPTGQRPVAVAYDYQTNQIAAAAAVSNSVGIASASSTALNTGFSVNLPSSIAYDPWNNNFLAASSSNNSVTIYDPTTQLLVGSLLVGINPTAIAFNSLTGTLVSTNTGSNTVTVADILNKEVRAVLSLRPPPVNSNVALSGAPQFAVDIHPLTNLAVIADTANGSILLVPLPR